MTLKPTLSLRRIKLVLLFGLVMTSFGILLVTVGGSWDITNHLLNKPETFFSPPHALLYIGVAIALIGTIVSFFTWRIISDKQNFKSSILISLLGMALLIGAGPFDFVWHSNFGLDGLLSPPHLTLITGMLLTAIGSLVGIFKFIKEKNDSRFNYLSVLAVLPIWLSASGLFHSGSLPFSNTEFFNFNPDPTFAVLFASVAFPFLVSFCLLLSSAVSKYQFGVLSVTGFLFLVVSSFTAILPNSAILFTIPFYFLSLIPIISADLLLRFVNHHKQSVLFVGGILGASFLAIYFPLTTFTYNEILTQQTVWPSLIPQVYFEMITDVFLITLIPAVVMGIVGVIFAKRVCNKILAS
ncbi:MAG: hypothetical protein DWQ18_03830 [Crenarchaeota archaeon]|nr:MAG: hypothetical protein DWQ17_09300 [Thermoproteota archaeon]RDJ34042.1 MAG: hypothetical protein DWQ18_03830 [Thermoproteota archaeon]RDJ36844.1 MAG: hypothetical protein DWQ13_06785 [Thermoproteota archaeon]RDJ37622.1 MAG: hypothetical protein DWQ19_04050 [Thermoproteota archaeon]